LTTRLAELEERVTRLENGPARPASPSRPVVNAAPDEAGSADLVAALTQALTQLGEADAGSLRQALIKNGLPATLNRSDVNKALYAHQELFKIARQEGMKPMWALKD